jgi:predicted HicB family RNase H-like nuclease
MELAMRPERPTRSVVFLRCPEELHEQLAAAAKQSLRSLNSEAVYRLQASLKPAASDAAV